MLFYNINSFGNFKYLKTLNLKNNVIENSYLQVLNYFASNLEKLNLES